MKGQKSNLKFILALLITVGILGILVSAPAFAREKEIIILHTNDFHGQLLPSKGKDTGGAAYLAALIEKIKKENPGKVLLLDAGDIAQGTPLSNEFKGEPVVEIMNYLKYDAMAIGNHEFDWRQPALKQMIKWAKFPVVCANIVLKDNPKKLAFNVKPFIIKEVSGVKIGILGLTTTETPSITKVENVKGLIFEDPAKAARKYIPLMKKEGAQIIVALTHQGVDDDRKLAEEAPEIDLIVGGHSHTNLFKPDKVGNTMIVQAGSKGRFLGEMKLTYSPESKKVENWTTENELIAVSHKDIEPDRNVIAIIEKFEKKAGPKFKKPVGETKNPLGRSCEQDHSDSTLGDMICDAMRSKSGADISFYNPGGIRADLPAGKLLVEDMINILPFDNWLVTFNMKGENIQKILEHGAAGHSSVQVSGITFDIDYNKPAGQRVSNVMVAGKPLENDKVYEVSTIDFLYGGGDKYPFKEYSEGLKYGDHIRDIVTEYVEEFSPLDIKADKRIKASNKSTEKDEH